MTSREIADADSPRSGPAGTGLLGSPRVGVRAAFATQGFVFISLTTRLPAFTDRWSISETTLSGLLLMMVLLAGAGSVVAEALARRHGSAVALRCGLALMVVAVPVLASGIGYASFVAGMALYGIALGLVDAGTNMQGVTVERLEGRPLMPSFFGAWTCGGVAGAALTLVAADAPLEWVALLALIPGGVLLFAGLVPGARDVPGGHAGTDVVLWRPILLVGAAMVVFYLVDTAATTWGPMHMDQTFGASNRWVALATFPYLVASGVVRLLGDRLVARFGTVLVLRCAGLVGFAGLALVVGAPSWLWAVLGFTVTGAGVAVVAPLSFSAAGRIAASVGDPARVEARTDVVVARFNQFNYVGALLGSVLTGLVGADSLRWGFAVPMVLVLLLLPLARAFMTRRSAPEEGTRVTPDL